MVLDVGGLLPTSFRTSAVDPSHVTDAPWQGKLLFSKGHGVPRTLVYRPLFAIAFSRIALNASRINTSSYSPKEYTPILSASLNSLITVSPISGYIALSIRTVISSSPLAVVITSIITFVTSSYINGSYYE
ncbi:hypothetical protein G7Y89_g14407 [Cudoniella acicularis]|uniref:Uncharacterized protein n=1 Tax=Cudoniella acicularis TaxID=354080 RepID=A0A8H4R428_9HELO|nr:hypothetical protein G7Y89_g14407 [Cudoniella acicularis]